MEPYIKSESNEGFYCDEEAIYDNSKQCVIFWLTNVRDAGIIHPNKHNEMDE